MLVDVVGLPKLSDSKVNFVWPLLLTFPVETAPLFWDRSSVFSEEVGDKSSTVCKSTAKHFKFHQVNPCGFGLYSPTLFHNKSKCLEHQDFFSEHLPIYYDFN